MLLQQHGLLLQSCHSLDPKTSCLRFALELRPKLQLLDRCSLLSHCSQLLLVLGLD